MASGERATISGEDRVRIVKHNRQMLDMLCGKLTESQLRSMVQIPDIANWATAVRLIYVQPAIQEMVALCGDAPLGLRGTIIGRRTSVSALFPKKHGVIESVDVPGIDELLKNGTDRVDKDHVIVFPVDDRAACEAGLLGMCETILKFYKCAQGQRDYCKGDLQPALIFYDLSQLVTKKDSKAYYLPSDLNSKAAVIKAVYPFDVTPLLPEEL